MFAAKELFLLFGAIFVASSTILATPYSASAKPSSFYRTCRNISIQRDTLKASCRRKNGSYLRSSLRLEGITNINGNLEYKPGKPSTFHKSCNHIQIRRDLLSANCRKINGRLITSNLRLNDIHNRNGYLKKDK